MINKKTYKLTKTGSFTVAECVLYSMDWWYKNETINVTPDTKINMHNAIVSVLRDGNSLATIKLFHDANSFFIKTTNKIVLSHFLFSQGFEEIDEEDKPADLKLLFEAG